MKSLLRILSISAIVTLAFASSGIFANLFFYYFPCIYVSSGVFSVGFLAVGAAILKMVSGVMDFLDWFH